MRSVRCHAHCPGPYRGEWPAAGGTGCRIRHKGPKGWLLVEPSWVQQEDGRVSVMLWDGGDHWAVSPRSRLGSQAVPREGAVPQAAGQGKGSGEEMEVPGWCWHTGWQEPDTCLFCALLPP